MPINPYNNVINYSFIDYIIKSYAPELKYEDKAKRFDMEIFKEAMLHISTKVQDSGKTYERLEYLGDAIFHMIITEYFYKRYDDENEGFLTKLRIRIERGDSMAELSKILELDKFVQLSTTFVNDDILEDIFEAFIAAFYLNFGVKNTRLFLINIIEKHKNLSELIYYDDNYKDLLLRYFHQMKWGHPIYIENKSCDNNKVFVITVKNPFDEVIGKGTSTSKKKAEQLASKNALIAFNVITNNEIDNDWINKIEKEEKEEKNKDKTDKKITSVFNPNNKLIRNQDVTNILSSYNVRLEKGVKINLKMFQESMTHRSYLTRKNLSPDDKLAAKTAVKLQKKSNERLRFIGDAIIHFIIAEHLFYTYPVAGEGFLTRLRCKLENKDSLYYLAKQTDISSYLLISQNIEILHGRNNVNIISGGLEAFVGAVYLDFGLNITKQFVLAIIRTELNITEIAESETNYKDLILHLYNKNHWGRPDYKVIKEEGPDHCKIFIMGIYFRGKLMGEGKASSKKKAEQIASKQMYHKIVAEK